MYLFLCTRNFNKNCFVSSLWQKNSLWGSVEVLKNRLKPTFLHWSIIILWDIFSSSKNWRAQPSSKLLFSIKKSNFFWWQIKHELLAHIFLGSNSYQNMKLLNASKSGKERRRESQALWCQSWLAGLSLAGGTCACCEIQCIWRPFLQWEGQDRLFANWRERGRQDSSSLQEWRSPAVRLSCKTHTEFVVSDTQQRPQTWGDPASKLIIYKNFICFPGKWFLVFGIAVLDNSSISCFRGGWKQVVRHLHLGNSCLMAGMYFSPK